VFLGGGRGGVILRHRRLEGYDFESKACHLRLKILHSAVVWASAIAQAIAGAIVWLELGHRCFWVEGGRKNFVTSTPRKPGL
jgi:hypothetical protein